MKTQRPLTHLDALVAAQVKIELGGMGDTNIDRRTGRYVTTLPALFLLVGAEQPGVVTLLHHYERDARLIVRLQFDAGLADGRQFVLEQLQKLPFRHSVPIQDYPMRLVAARRFVKHYQQFPAKAKLMNKRN